ncbi:MAG: MBL fold metallo-hydrolase [Bacteriovoracaceae bacterium]|nr:MBL fold metallo-hydrolase [Bacteriovoracaceae bacterium]
MIKNLVLIFVLFSGCTSPNSQEPLKVGQTVAPYDGEKFNNLEPFKAKSFMDLMKWRFTSSREEWPEFVDSTQVIPKKRSDKEKVFYTIINHATVLIQISGLNILTDPQYSKRASPFSWIGPKRVREPGISFENLPPIDVVLISHNHYDHLDLPTLKRLSDIFKPEIYVGLKNKPLLEEAGIVNVYEFDWWQQRKFKDIEITFVPAQHWSARGMFDRFETLWGGFYMKSPKHKVYFAGDTGFGSFFRLIKEKLGAPDLAFIPIGAYEPRWFMKNAHVNPLEAIMGHEELEAKQSIGIHFETFQLTNEAYGTPRKEFNEAWSKSKKVNKFIAPEFGQIYEFID